MTDQHVAGTEMPDLGALSSQLSASPEATSPPRVELPGSPGSPGGGGGPFKSCGGSKNPDFNDIILLETLATVYSPGSEPGTHDERQDRRGVATAQALTAFGAKDEVVSQGVV